jgi:hypothetical protein
MNGFLSEFATTNARIALSLCLWCLTILVAIVGLLLGRIDVKALTTLDHIFVALLIAMGVDVVQYIGKRVTFEPDAHATPLRGDTTPARTDDIPLTPPAIAQQAAQPAIPVTGAAPPLPPVASALVGDGPPRAAPMARPSHAG